MREEIVLSGEVLLLICLILTAETSRIFLTVSDKFRSVIT